MEIKQLIFTVKQAHPVGRFNDFFLLPVYVPRSDTCLSV